MKRMAELLPTFVVNAAWQIALVALAASLCARLLRDRPARLRHALWVAALLLSVALPLRGLFDSEAEAPRAPASQLRIVSAERRHANNEPALASAPADDAATTADDFTLGALVRARRRAVASAPWLSYALAAVYALFVLFRARLLWGAWRRARLLRRGASACAPREVEEIAARCREAFGLREVKVVCSRAAAAPFTVGARGPVVILPMSFAEGMPEESLLSALGHEAAHVARRDFAFNLAYELLLLPVSFHPLARVVKRQIDRTREVACDELVAGRLLAPDVYARSLVRVAGALAPPAAEALTLGVFDADILEERIMRLTRHAHRPGRRATIALCLAAFSTLCLAGVASSSFSFNLRPDASVVAPATASANGAAQESRQEPKERKEPNHKELQPDAQARGEIAQAIASDNPQSRARAACKAGHRHAVDLIPALTSMLGDDSEIEQFDCWESGDWSPALSTFKRPSPGEQAAIALASMGTPALEPLTRALDDGSATARRNAAWAIGELTEMRETQRAPAVPRLVSLLSDSDDWVRSAAARALGEIRDERSVAPLMNALSDGQPNVRQRAAWALGEFKAARAVAALGGVLVSDPQAEVRQRAARALGEIQSREALSYLKQAQNDPEPRVREAVNWALSEIEGDGNSHP